MSRWFCVLPSDSCDFEPAFRRLMAVAEESQAMLRRIETMPR